MLGQNVTHANFSVDDLAAAKSFYVDKLGFKVKYELADAMLILESGAGTLIGVYYKPDHKAWDSTVMGIVVNDVRQTARELEASGIKLEPVDGTDENGIMSDPSIGDAAWFKDPAGNWICLEKYGKDLA